MLQITGLLLMAAFVFQPLKACQSLRCGGILNKQAEENFKPKPTPDRCEPELRWPVQWLTAGMRPSESYLGELESEIILNLNMARSDPARYARDFIEPRIDYFVDSQYIEPGRPILLTSEGADAVRECVQVMMDTDPMTALSPSRGLCMAALDHALDQSETGETGHTGSDGSSFADRVSRHGRWSGTIGEVITYGPITAREIVVSLLIDDGVQGRTHRINLLNPDFRYVGVAIRKHSVFSNVCVIEFAKGFRDN